MRVKKTYFTGFESSKIDFYLGTKFLMFHRADLIYHKKGSGLMVLMSSMTGGMDSQQGFDNNFNMLLPMLMAGSDDDE